MREYCIKDNESFGQYDWDLVANEWDTDEITGWGVELPLFTEQPDSDDGKAEDAPIKPFKKSFILIACDMDQVTEIAEKLQTMLNDYDIEITNSSN